MDTITHALWRVFQAADDTETLQQIALFCGAGLLVTLLCMNYGLDFGPGWF